MRDTRQKKERSSCNEFAKQIDCLLAHHPAKQDSYMRDTRFELMAELLSFFSHSKGVPILETENLIKEFLESFGGFSVDDIPDIDLYMDQVTTLLNSKFEVFKRNDEDKLLTKTMINNYAKFRILPSPEKKKYSKDHIIVLILIFFFKNVLSINDTGTLIGPAVEQFFHNEEQPLAEIYNNFVEGIKTMNDDNEILELYKKCTESFDFDAYENKEYLQTLSYIAILSYQAYVRQQVVIKLIDSL